MWRLAIFFVIVQSCVAPPVTKGKPSEEQDSASQDGLEDFVEYHRYIKEVVKALESDPVFRQKLEHASDAEIRSGSIAHELELVSHKIRTRLDEIKRTELHRLKQLAARRNDLLNNELNRDDPLHHHIDHDNPHTFEIEDLRKLIMKTTEDLAEADRKRREEFKLYELQKEYEKMGKLNHTATGEERQKMEQEYKDMEAKHKQHEKLHTPGHKEHLKEVWEEQDHMTQDFNPKTFFMLHDLDSNGLWDQDEVKALFIKELDKMYADGAPEDDMRERVEEMERMRESVFTEIDTNRDGFIDFPEFLEQTKRNNFDKDPGWKSLAEERPFTDEELEEYVRLHNMPNGYPDGNPQMYPPGYPNVQMPPPQGYQNGQMQYQGHPQGQMPPQAHSQGQFHPGQLPQAQIHPQQISNMPPGNQAQLNTNEVYANVQSHQQQPVNPPQYQSIGHKSQEVPAHVQRSQDSVPRQAAQMPPHQPIPFDHNSPPKLPNSQPVQSNHIPKK